MTMNTNANRYSAALGRVVDARGDNAQTLQDFNAAITAKYPRLDLIADQAEAYADDVERQRGADLAAAALDTNEAAVSETMRERVTLAMWQIDNWDWVCEIEAQAADHADLLDTQASAIF